jgi:hypothetical protein
MTDFSHLNAIEERLHRETMRFMSATNEQDRQFRFSQVKQAERELEGERKFLGIDAPIAHPLTDDELLAELIG